MTTGLKNFQNRLKKQCFGDFAEENQDKGLCIQCKEPALENCYSEAGKRKFKLSGLCEKCFDEICGGGE